MAQEIEQKDVKLTLNPLETMLIVEAMKCYSNHFKEKIDSMEEEGKTLLFGRNYVETLLGDIRLQMGLPREPKVIDETMMSGLERVFYVEPKD